MAAIDAAAFREHFPLLERTVYLASCSLGARSNELDAALARMLEAMTGRSAWHCFEEQIHEARRRFAHLIGAQPEQVAIVPNASVGAYQVASTFDWPRRSKLITTDLEFPSVAHVWLAQRARGVQVEYVPERACGVVADDYLSRLDENTGLVSVPLATYRNGARLPVPEVAAAARRVGARVFVDAYQAVGVLPVNVDALECDFLVAGAMKYLLGLPGVAFLYARSASTSDCLPTLTGWFGRVDPMSFDPRRLDFPAEARRFETGTPDVPALYAANAGMAMIGSLDQRDVNAHVAQLTDYAARQLTAQGEQLRFPSEAAARGAQVALVDEDAPKLAEWLAERDIIVSPRRDVARLSFHYYNNARDVDVVCAAIQQHRRLY
jgi:selenocysteine lyase/cysteine desulfurase